MGLLIEMKLKRCFLPLFLLIAFWPMQAAAAEEGEKLSKIAVFNNIELYDAGDGGQGIGEKIQDRDWIGKDKQLMLYYQYEIPENMLSEIQAGTEYFLEVSPHLVLADLGGGSPLMIETEDGEEQFGTIYADGSRAWVVFLPNADGSGTVLSEYGGIKDAFFYLNCHRAGAVPSGEFPIEGQNNLYAIKFENNTQLIFGYAEDEAVETRAWLDKDGSLSGKTISWTINYTPWQNPSGNEGITESTPFELQDTIDTALHHYVENSVTIDGDPVPDSSSRDNIPEGAEAYVIVEAPEDGDGTVLILTFGGTKFSAGNATQGSPAQPLHIGYETVVKDELLLPGKGESQEITNEAALFAGMDGTFRKMDIGSRKTVSVPQPEWITKTGTTTRHTDGTGATTEWTLAFSPNGFEFTKDHALTLHDRLPVGSTLISNSVMVNRIQVSAVEEADNSFTVSPIEAAGQPVEITYQTSISEDMYQSGTSLGDNTAWFTFLYNGTDYETPQAVTPVGSGDGSGSSGTATIVKSNGGYREADRTIPWTVTINPHKAYLKSGTFIDNLGIVGGSCHVEGHMCGLALANGADDVQILINGQPPSETEKNLVKLTYDQQILTLEAGEIGAKMITLQFVTRVCDPCIFANNTVNKPLKNIVSTENMVLGNQSGNGYSASAESTVTVNTSVLAKKEPVYDYAAKRMKWAVEVDASGLSMEDIVLTDILPTGFTYADGSISVDPELPDASAVVSGQELTITLGAVTGKTMVTFDTAVDPEAAGFSSNEAVRVVNEIEMNGAADGVVFEEVSDTVEKSFANHGLVKSSNVDNGQELIRYEVLINPFGLSLPEKPSLEDTLDRRLQLDTDTLYFYKADVSGTTVNKDQKPKYTKQDGGQKLKVSSYDPATNSFTVQLPVEAGSRDAYVLAYTADIIERQQDAYSNSVRFEGGSVFLGGNKNNSAAVSGGGGGGGGGVAARKAGIAIVKTDMENKEPLAGVTFALYQWDGEKNKRGLLFAQGSTDGEGKLSFKVSPNTTYELVETEGLPGYDSKICWTQLPAGVEETEQGLLMTTGAAKSEIRLELGNKPHAADLVFRLFNGSGIPMAGEKVELFVSDPSVGTAPVPDAEAVVSADGTVRFSDMRRGMSYFIRQPGGEIFTIEIPLDTGEKPRIKWPDGTEAILTEDFQMTGSITPDRQWELTVMKVGDEGTIPLSGAEFGLYAEKGCQTLLQKASSGLDGTLVFAGLMKGQKYWLKEKAAPPGYQLNTTIYEIDEENLSITIPNIVKTTPEAPGEPDNPGTNDKPETPEIPDRPGTPGGPELPDKPETPGKPGIPDQPEIPGRPGTPGQPGTPGESGTPDQPGESGKPATPENGKPEISDSSTDLGQEFSDGGENKDSSEISEMPGNSGSPKTGNNTYWLLAVVLLLGMLLAVMTLYSFITGRKHGKK